MELIGIEGCHYDGQWSAAGSMTSIGRAASVIRFISNEGPFVVDLVIRFGLVAICSGLVVDAISHLLVCYPVQYLLCVGYV
jgi:hypothetical protein